jgi:hypothetical protein
MTHDRVRQEGFHLSHQFLALMLGTTVRGHFDRLGL